MKPATSEWRTDDSPIEGIYLVIFEEFTAGSPAVCEARYRRGKTIWYLGDDYTTEKPKYWAHINKPER